MIHNRSFFQKVLLFGCRFCTLWSMHTHKPIIHNSIDQMASDPNIVRLTFLTTFFHSMIVMLLIILNANKLFVQYTEKWSDLAKIPQFLIEEINKNHVVLIFILVTIVFFLLYSVVYPIGQAAVIHYLHHKKSIRDSIKSSFKNFYPMFEFWFISALFSAVTLFFLAFKIFVLDWSRNIYIFVIFVLWAILINMVNKFKVYTRYFIVLHDLPLYESLKQSFLLTKKSLKATSKYMAMQTRLLINFSLNLVLIIWLPLLLIHLAIVYNAISFWYVKVAVYLLFFILIVAGAYMSSFIRAFFAYYWYDVFMRMAPSKDIVKS